MHGDLRLGFARRSGIDDVDVAVAQCAHQRRRGAAAGGRAVEAVVDDEDAAPVQDAGHGLRGPFGGGSGHFGSFTT